MTDGNINTANLLVLIARIPVGLLVDDGVHSNGGFTGLAVTNDELTLSSSHRNHGVNSLDTRLKWLVHTATIHHAGSLEFQGTAARSLDLT